MAASEQTTDYDVIVVGAGAAGMAATNALAASGLSVMCLEADSRIGGRTHTDSSIFGVPCDLGAHWLHNAHVNPFVEIGKSLGLDMYAAPDMSHSVGLEDEDILWDEVEQIEEQLSDAAVDDTDRSIADVFRPSTPWSLTAVMMHGLNMGRDLSQVSLHDWDRELDGSNWFCRQGFGHLVALHAGDFPVSLSTPVDAITRTASGVTVQAAQGTLTARAVIVTVSLGVLTSGAIRFDPPLENDRLRALDGITMGCYNHAVLQFAPGALPVKPDTWATYQITDIRDGVPQGGGFLCDISGNGLTMFESSGSFARDLEQEGAKCRRRRVRSGLTFHQSLMRLSAKRWLRSLKHVTPMPVR